MEVLPVYVGSHLLSLSSTKFTYLYLYSVQNTDSESVGMQPHVGAFYSDLALVRQSAEPYPTVYDARMQHVSASHSPF